MTEANKTRHELHLCSSKGMPQFPGSGSAKIKQKIPVFLFEASEERIRGCQKTGY